MSRGEYFTARLMAEYLGLPFLDAATVVAFHHDGTLSMNRTSELVQEYGQQGGFVMPGFYGATREGQIKLLDRGGGDISGSILAKCLGADLYENWTDVSGFYSADPRIVPEAQPIARVTYGGAARAFVHGRKRPARGGRVPRARGGYSAGHQEHQCAAGPRYHH